MQCVSKDHSRSMILMLYVPVLWLCASLHRPTKRAHVVQGVRMSVCKPAQACQEDVRRTEHHNGTSGVVLMQCGRPTPQGPQPLARTLPEAACCVCVQLHLSPCAISTLSSAACVPLLFSMSEPPAITRPTAVGQKQHAVCACCFTYQSIKKVTMHH